MFNSLGRSHVACELAAEQTLLAAQTQFRSWSAFTDHYNVAHNIICQRQLHDKIGWGARGLCRESNTNSKWIAAKNLISRMEASVRHRQLVTLSSVCAARRSSFCACRRRRIALSRQILSHKLFGNRCHLSS